MQDVLITGGAGFIGANLVRWLAREGVRSHVIDDLSSGNRSYLDDISPAPRLVEGRVQDLDLLADLCMQADAVVHLAALTGVQQSVTDPPFDFTANVEGSFDVLEAARRSGVSRVILASSGAVVSGSRGRLDENVPPSPLSPYGASKAYAESAGMAYAAAFDMSVLAFRFSNVYGRFCAHKGSVIPTFLMAALFDQPLTIFGSGRQTRDFIHVSDVCRAIVRGLRARRNGVLHLASGTSTSVLEVARTVRRIAPTPIRIEYHPKRRGDAHTVEVDASLARRALRWSPRVALEEGIASTLDWLQWWM